MRLYQEEVAWVARIHQALAERRFELARQLIVPSKEKGQGLKYEILLRLRAENGELIRPAQFIGAAERFGLMPQIDLWVLENLLKWYADNPDELARLSMVSVNLSGESVGTPKMHRKIRRLLEAADFPYQRLCFEITESQAIANIDATKAFIETFKGLGCAFALDDFGSGFSSFSYLRDLPLTYLKIDGNFVHNLVANPVDAAMVKAVHEVGQVMKLLTIAELVEDEQTLSHLRVIGVDYAQGYFCGRPIPMDQLSFPVSVEQYSNDTNNRS